VQGKGGPRKRRKKRFLDPRIKYHVFKIWHGTLTERGGERNKGKEGVGKGGEEEEGMRKAFEEEKKGPSIGKDGSITRLGEGKKRGV